MAKKRRSNRAHPLMIFWSKRDALRFTEAVERFQSLVNDLEIMVEKEKRKRVARPKPLELPPQEVAP